MTLARQIKEYGLDIGFSRVGVTDAEDFSDYAAELLSRGDYYDFHLANPAKPLLGTTPKKIMPEAKSIVVAALDYAQRDFPRSLSSMIGRVYQTRAYMPRPTHIHGARIGLMRDFLRANGCAVDADMYVPMRAAAARAGVTTFGRNTFAYADGIGSFIVLYAFVVDKELDVDSPTLENKCPAGCRACMDACPTKAIYEPFKLNPRKCLAFNAWKTQEGAGCGITPVIPRDIREQMGTRVHGCDFCQEACPRNQKKVRGVFPEDPLLLEIAKEMTLSALLRMEGDFFETRVRPIMYNYLREPKYFQRNAAVAIGNTCDAAFVPDLAAAMGNPEEMVRVHAAWALGRIGGAKAKEILVRYASSERSESVKEEIALALESA